VQGKTYATVTFNNVSSSPGTSIASYKTVCDSIADTTSPYQTGYLASGTRTIYGYVYDRRGRSTYKTTTVTVQPYALPYLTNITAYRSNSSGTAQDEGTYITFKAKANFSSCSNHNSATLSYVLKNSSGGTVLSGTFSNNAETTIGSGNISINSSYKLILTVTDALNESQSYERLIDTSLVSFNIRAGGKGVAFGKYSEHDNELDCNSSWTFGNSLKLAYANSLMPIGHIIITADSRNPSTYIPGTTWVALQDRTLVGVGTHSVSWTDGSETHTLLENQLPQITGNFQIRLAGGYNTVWTNSGGAFSVADSSSSTNYVTLSGSSGKVQNVKLQFGGGRSHNNLQPSAARYMWQRTA
jgi:hypothetical protein